MEVIKKAFLQGEVEVEGAKEGEDIEEEEEHDAASPRNVGHNIYILAHQVFCIVLCSSCFLCVSACNPRSLI